MKIYKTYFEKTDTPFKQTYQKKRKYHSCWFRSPYKKFLGHQVYMIKMLGLFTIYKKEWLEE